MKSGGLNDTSVKVWANKFVGKFLKIALLVIAYQIGFVTWVECFLRKFYDAFRNTILVERVALEKLKNVEFGIK